MENDKIKIIDESGDRKYFTLIPNYILNHSTANEQALYGQMKKFAGETGKCFATIETLSVKLHWNKEKVRRNIKKLLERKWIKGVGTIKSKTHPVNAYEIVDIWKLNVGFYEKKKKPSNEHYFEKGKRRSPVASLTRSPETSVEEEHLKEELTATPKVVASFIDKLLQSPQRHIHIIGLWVRETKIELPNKEVYESVMKRSLRVARLLVGYNDEDIIETIRALKGLDFLNGHFTLETVIKYVDDIIREKKKKTEIPIIQWEQVEKEGKIVMRPIYSKKL